MRYSWPGNLRELGNFVKRFLVLRDERLMIQELQEGNGNSVVPSSEGMATGSGGLKSLVRNLKDQAEGEAIRRSLEQTSWNRKTAAAMLNISYKALLYKMRQFNLDTPRTRKAASTTAVEESASAVGTRRD